MIEIEKITVIDLGDLINLYEERLEI